jgi:hypothetical protein
MHGCLARIESFLVRAGAALGMSPFATKASSPTKLNVGSAEVEEEGIFGGFSPHAMPCMLPYPDVHAASEDENMALVM